MMTKSEAITRTTPARKSWSEDIAWMASIYCEALSEEIMLNEGRQWRRVDSTKKNEVVEILRRILENENVGCLFIAKHEGRRIGYFLGMIKECMAEEPSRIGYVNGLYIVEEFRNSGVGQRLLEAGYGWFRSLDLTLVEIYTAWDNEIAKNFWKKNGFKPAEIVMIAPISSS